MHAALGIIIIIKLWTLSISEGLTFLHKFVKLEALKTSEFQFKVWSYRAILTEYLQSAIMVRSLDITNVGTIHYPVSIVHPHTLYYHSDTATPPIYSIGLA